MARNRVTIDATPDDVFDVLVNPWTYPRWVVGAKRVRSVDDDWPRPGSRFHHSVGAGPATVSDSSELLSLDPPSSLRLEVRFRPIGVAVVDFDVRAEGPGSVVTMSEEPRSGPVWAVWNRLLDASVHVRNELSLWLLRRVVEERSTDDRGA